MRTIKKVPALVFMLSLATPALAYLDPGAGSFILQMLIAGIVGALFTIKMYWYRLKSYVARLFGKTIENPMEDDDQDDEENNKTPEERND